MRIPRDRYLDRLIAKKRNGLVKVVTGARRCGKSFLLFELFREHLASTGVPEDHIVTIQLDDRAFKELRDPDACFEYVKSRIVDDGQYYVLIDEVQMMPEFEDVLNGFLHVPNLDVYATGSNSRFLSTDVITEFRGRGDEVNMHPLSFSEFHAALGRDWDDDWQDYMTFGGLPHIATLTDDREKVSYLMRLYQETYLRDIIEHNRIRNKEGLPELVETLASSIGSLTNPNRLANTFKSERQTVLTAPTIESYIGYLEDAFVVRRARRYDVKGRKYIASPMKYYFEDIGVRNAILNFRQQEPTHIMENILYNELVARGLSVDVGMVAAADDKTKKQVEIDFVVNEGSNRYYIQSAYALDDPGRRKQEERPLLKTGDSFKKIIVVGGSRKPFRDDMGVLTMGLKQFLLDPDSLDL